MDPPQGVTSFVSTAIPYVNAPPHIGFAFEVVLADAIARYRRARGRDVFFLSGTDDNSLKNVEAAEQRGIPVQTLVNENAQRFEALKSSLNLSFNDFIRTSADPRHGPAVERFWRACTAAGDIYLGEYEGLYCVGCEQFYLPSELQDGLCPEHLRPPELVSERNYFFRLSRYQDELVRLIRSGELEIVPDSRRSEILNFAEGGLEDFSISRSMERSRGWGLPVPGDPSQVIYVWFDALINYISALGYADEAERYQRYWEKNPNRLHVIGKGILRFHAAYWPAMLLSAGVPLPRTIFVHGYLTADGRKISKSMGAAADPHELARAFGTDALRFYLLSQFRPGDDGNFSSSQLSVARDHDLADQLGNLVSRVAAMVTRYRSGHVTRADGYGGDNKLIRVTEGLLEDVDRAMDAFEVNRAIGRIWEVVREANRYAVTEAPWELAKETSSAAEARLSAVLYDLAEALRLIAAFTSPFLPATAGKIASVLDLPEGWDRLSEVSATWGAMPLGTTVGAAVPLFPKE
jgi:methionyl-tRNA synthetase